MKNLMIIACLILATFSSNILNAQTPLTNTFTYQGELKFDNTLVGGFYDFRFSVFNVDTGGSALETLIIEKVAVTNGVFTIPVTLTNDLFTGNKIWLDIAVKAYGTADPFDPLSPRQEVTSSPYAIHAQFVGADAVTGVQIQNGTITASDVDVNSVQQRVRGICSSNQKITRIHPGGTVTCVIDNDTIAPPAWELGGNSGTTSGTEFIGTTDNQPLEIKTNGSRVALFGIETMTDGPNVVLGSTQNNVAMGVEGVVISGGGDPSSFACGVSEDQPCINQVTGIYGSIGGGRGNTVGTDSTIGGGFNGIASGSGATIGGGTYNTVSVSGATVGGGSRNIARNFEATIGGGYGNIASGENTTVGGGRANTASAYGATVPGGFGNSAGGQVSFAAGEYAIVRDSTATGDSNGDEGTFIWSDSTATSSNKFTSTGPNQFRVRATGGAYFDVSGSGLSPPGFHIEQQGASGVGMLIRQTSSDANLVLVNKGTGDLIKAFTGSGGGNLMFRVANTGNVTADGSFTGGGADFAEYLPTDEIDLQVAEVVGLKNGKLSRDTSRAQRVMVISTNPAFVGNNDSKGNSGKALAAFMGQVYVKVQGNVQSGDWLMASGHNDGYAQVVQLDKIKSLAYRQIVGQALESSDGDKVLTLVGLPAHALMANQQELISEQQLAIKSQQQQITTLQNQQQQILAQLQQTQKLKQQLAEIKLMLKRNPGVVLLAQNKEVRDE